MSVFTPLYYNFYEPERFVSFQVFMAVTILIMSFWVKAPCGLIGRANVSENRVVSIFKAEVMRRDSAGPYIYIYI
jgi:hypothetical protein